MSSPSNRLNWTWTLIAWLGVICVLWYLSDRMDRDAEALRQAAADCQYSC